MEIDISFLKNTSVVVWCRSYEEASILMENVVDVHPIIKRDLPPKVERFEKERDDEGMGFRFDHEGNSYDVGYATMDYYRECKYNIIELRDMIIVRDYGDLKISYPNKDAALAALF